MVFQEEGKPEYLDRKLRSNARTNNAVSVHQAPGQIGWREALLLVRHGLSMNARVVELCSKARRFSQAFSNVELLSD